MSFGAIPAEEFTDSDEDEGFMFSGTSGNHSNSSLTGSNAASYSGSNFSSNNQLQVRENLKLILWYWNINLCLFI